MKFCTTKQVDGFIDNICTDLLCQTFSKAKILLSPFWISWYQLKNYQP